MVWISRPRRRKALGDGAGGSVHSLDLERGHQRVVSLADELDVQEPILDDGLLFFVRGGGKPLGKKLVVAERFLSLEAHVETALAVFSLPDLDRSTLRSEARELSPADDMVPEIPCR